MLLRNPYETKWVASRIVSPDPLAFDIIDSHFSDKDEPCCAEIN
jgi:hypothetical protein